MKQKHIVHINFSDDGGGAAIAACRHCEAMRVNGIDATMLVASKTKQSKSYIYSISKRGIWSKLFNLVLGVYSTTLLKVLEASSLFCIPFFSYFISRNPLVKKADIIYIHWVSLSMLSTKEIERLAKMGKPIRWYLHDMNPITGGCHYSFECNNYFTGCQLCPHIKRLLGFNLAKLQYRKRIKCWSKYKNIEIYTPSQWLADCASNSQIWKDHQIVVFPNVIDTKKYRPVNKEFAKQLLGMDSHKKTILFGAAGINSPYKGWDYLQEALNKLNASKYECLIFGEESKDMKEMLKMSSLFTGYLHDEYSLILAYNAADVFVIPSLAENYPNVVMEAMSCGLPCVGFKVGGIPEQISHLRNGYIAEYKNPEDLSKGIKWVCEEANYEKLCKEARNFVVEYADYSRYSQMEV
jgi:glycosyltransferase involved in cell wall biosynthesis